MNEIFLDLVKKNDYPKIFEILSNPDSKALLDIGYHDEVGVVVEIILVDVIAAVTDIVSSSGCCERTTISQLSSS